MTSTEKETFVSECEKLLQKGEFPTKKLAELKESRLRKDIIRKVFDYSSVKFDSLSAAEKTQRKLALKTKTEYYSYLQSFLIFRNLIPLLFCTGVVLWYTASIGINNNGVFGYITLGISLLLLAISFSKKLITKLYLSIVIVYTVLYLLELFILGVPEPLHATTTLNPLGVPAGGGLLIIVNQLSPILYEAIKITILGLLIWVSVKQSRFRKAVDRFKTSFEQG